MIIFIACGLTAFGQNDPATEKLLNSLREKYQSHRTARINFTLTATNQQKQVTADEKGELIVEPRSNKFRITLNDQAIISDGKLQWHVLKDEQEVQITEADGGESGSITPANIFSFYSEGFKYPAAKNETVGGKSFSVVDLVPIDGKASYVKVRLRVDKSIHQIYDVTVFDKSGALYTYAIRNFTPNVKVTSKTFIFDKTDYPGMEIVDLR